MSAGPGDAGGALSPSGDEAEAMAMREIGQVVAASLNESAQQLADQIWG